MLERSNGDLWDMPVLDDANSCPPIVGFDCLPEYVGTVTEGSYPRTRCLQLRRGKGPGRHDTSAAVPHRIALPCSGHEVPRVTLSERLLLCRSDQVDTSSQTRAEIFDDQVTVRLLFLVGIWSQTHSEILDD